MSNIVPSSATIVRYQREQGPGPGQYPIPEQFGKAALKYTIRPRYKDKKQEPLPGYPTLPATFGDAQKSAFHIRPKDLKKDPEAGPNYLPPAFGKDALKSQFHGRSDVFGSVFQKVKQPTPSGHDYKPGMNNKPNAPRWTIKNRFDLLSGLKNDKEAGGAAGADGTTAKERTGHGIYVAGPNGVMEVVGPGPGAYLPNYSKVLPKTPQIMIRNRLDTGKINVTPGPSDYFTPKKLYDHPAYFHQRIQEKSTDVSPGPGKYSTATQLGKDARRWTIRPRTDTGKPVQLPGYEKYTLPGDVGTGQKWSLHVRPKEKNPDVVAGPNYLPPKFGSDAQKNSFGIRRGFGKDLIQTPGPNYLPPSTNDGHKFSMKARNFPPDGTLTAGPGGGRYFPDYNKLYGERKGRQIHERFKTKDAGQTCGYYDLGSTLLNKKYGITIGKKLEILIGPGNW